MPDRTLLAPRAFTALALAVLVAACGGSPAASFTVPSAAPRIATPSMSASAQASAIPGVATPSTSGGPAASLDTTMVDLLPAELGGAATQKLAIEGDHLSSLNSSAAMIFISVLAQLGADAGNMTAAAVTNTKASIIAIRVAGKTAQQISDAMKVGRTLNAATTETGLDLGGKHVVKITTSTAPVPFYLYGSGDISFTVAATDESIVAEAFSKLP
jgi:hypothetical protein